MFLNQENFVVKNAFYLQEDQVVKFLIRLKKQLLKIMELEDSLRTKKDLKEYSKKNMVLITSLNYLVLVN